MIFGGLPASRTAPFHSSKVRSVEEQLGSVNRVLHLPLADVWRKKKLAKHHLNFKNKQEASEKIQIRKLPKKQGNFKNGQDPSCQNPIKSVEDTAYMNHQSQERVSREQERTMGN